MKGFYPHKRCFWGIYPFKKKEKGHAARNPFYNLHFYKIQMMNTNTTDSQLIQQVLH